MFAQERQRAIQQIVRTRRRLSFAELQELIKVSPATLRRDLTELEASGDLIRVHGGVMDPAYVRAEISLDDRVLRNHAAKKSIAALAVALIPPGATVLVDAGSTCLEAGKMLLGRTDVRLITHSVALLAASRQGVAEVICLGGELRRVSGALVGASALGALATLRADFAFISATGLEATDGCSTTELSEATMKKALLERATRRVLLADQSKWGHPSTVRFAEWSDLNDFVTDSAPPHASIRHLKSQGLQLHVAKARSL